MYWKILKQVVSKRFLNESRHFSGLRKFIISRPSIILDLKIMKGDNLPECPFLANVLETMRQFFFLKNPRQDIEHAEIWERSLKSAELGTLLSHTMVAWSAWWLCQISKWALHFPVSSATEEGSGEEDSATMNQKLCRNQKRVR